MYVLMTSSNTNEHHETSSYRRDDLTVDCRKQLEDNFHSTRITVVHSPVTEAELTRCTMARILSSLARPTANSPD